jgi:predicted metal-dependent hydrolase
LEIKIDRVLRSRRRTIGLEINEEAQLIVRAPRYVSEGYIEEIVSKKRDWILAKQKAFIQRKIDYPLKQFVNGERFYFLGKPYIFKIVDDGSIRFSDCLEFPRRLLLNARDNLVQWYKDYSYVLIKERVQYYALAGGLSYASIKISNARTLFGSCSHKGNLNFSWRIIMAPPDVLDYVVVHELAHLKERNHGPRFWDQVGLILPDYRMRRRFFRLNHGLFNL